MRGGMNELLDREVHSVVNAALINRMHFKVD